MHFRWLRLEIVVLFVLTDGDTDVMLDIGTCRCSSGGRWIDDDIVDATVYICRKQNIFEIQCLELRVGLCESA